MTSRKPWNGETIYLLGEFREVEVEQLSRGVVSEEIRQRCQEMLAWTEDQTVPVRRVFPEEKTA